MWAWILVSWVAWGAPSPELQAALEEIKTDRLFREADVALEVVDLDSGEVVLSHEGERALVPASTMKIVTAAAALDALGPSWRFSTEVYVDGPVGGDGVLRGNLYVKGGGDPTLVVERLWKVVVDLKLHGVRRVAGHVILDETYLSTDYLLPGWDKAADVSNGPTYFPSLGALSLNSNAVGLVAGPGPAPGQPARVELETPAGDYVKIQSTVKTGGPGSRTWVDVDRSSADGLTTFTVQGAVAADADPVWVYRTIENPTSHFAAVLAELFRAQSLVVEGRFKRGTVPAAADLLLSSRSEPLGAVLMEMNKHSRNLHAELVLRALGAEVHGSPGTTEKGLQVVDAYLKRLGLQAGDYQLVNGSGLSREIRFEPKVLTRILLDMDRRPQVGGEFAASLAIAGRDGTLWRRLADEAGKVRGKTGTLDGVHCLTGYVDSASSRRYAFAFLVNGFSGSSAPVARLHDRFAREILQLPESREETARPSGRPRGGRPRW